MSRSAVLLFALSAFAASAAPAQSPDLQSTPAPVQRVAPNGPETAPPPPEYGSKGANSLENWNHRQHPMRPHTFAIDPVEGVRIVSDHRVDTIGSQAANSDDTTEFRLDHGRANVLIDHPQAGSLILLDLPGGQVDFVHDGLYTVNADTDTVRVLRGEADVFPPNAPADAKGVTVREGQQVVLSGDLHPTDAPGAELRADLLSPGLSGRPHGEDDGGYGYYGGYYPPLYGWGAPVYPYYGWGYPYYGWGGPYAWDWGWPGLGWGYPYGAGLGFGLGWGGYYPGWGGYYGSRGWQPRHYVPHGFARGSNGFHGGTSGAFRGGSRSGGFHSGSVRSFHGMAGGGFHGGSGGFHGGGSFHGGGGSAHGSGGGRR